MNKTLTKFNDYKSPIFATLNLALENLYEASTKICLPTDIWMTDCIFNELCKYYTKKKIAQEIKKVASSYKFLHVVTDFTLPNGYKVIYDYRVTKDGLRRI